MKKLFAIICASLVFPVFAEVRPVFYEEEVIEEVDAPQQSTAPQVSVKPPVVVGPATNINRTANVRGAGVSNRQSNTAASRAVASSRAAVTQPIRTTAVRSGVNTARPVSSRTASIQNRSVTQSRNAAQGRSQALAGAIVGGGNTPVSKREDADTKQRTVQARAGSLYTPGIARVGVASGGVTSAVGRASRTLSTPSLFNSTNTTTTAATSTSSSEELAAQTDFCKAQYAACMDGFCAVLDDNQGRCSCSSTITKYEKTERALKQATIQLEDVAAKIKYLGLSGDEVRTLFTQTAAEQALQQYGSDTSALRNDLSAIEKMLIDPTSQVTTSGGLISFNFDNLNLGNGFEMGSFMDFMDTSGTISNQRGAALFSTAQTRCETILSDCKRQGVDSKLVTAHYDLEVDRQCIAYERALIDSNDQMNATIRNATSVLQQARLMVAQNKNRYDLKGCVNALDSCMMDEFVCGDGYDNCLDPSGKYIVNGDIVIGSGVSQTAIATANKGSVTGADENDYLKKFLTEKIGTIDKEGRAIGMCASVMNQCQNYTFDRTKNTYMDGEYDQDTGSGNRVLTEFLNRTIVNIKARQLEVLIEYGENCRQDIINCFAKNTAVEDSTQKETVINSCRDYIDTCAGVVGVTEYAANSDVARRVCQSGYKLAKTGDTWGCATTATNP